MKGRQINTPTSVPTVPGAKGARPEPNPVARNVISFSFKIAPEECFCGFIYLRDTTPRLCQLRRRDSSSDASSIISFALSESHYRFAPGIISNSDKSELDSSAYASSSLHSSSACLTTTCASNFTLLVFSESHYFFLDNRTIVLYHRFHESQANFTGCGEKNHRLFPG